MHVAVRPPLAAAALVGAGLLAVPAVAPMPDVHPRAVVQSIQAGTVDLLASSSPFALYEKVFRAALANAEQLGDDTALTDFLHQFVTNQVGYLTTLAEGLGAAGGAIAEALTTQVPQLATTALQQLAAGKVSDAVNSLLAIPLVAALPATEVLPALQSVLTTPLRNLVNIIDAFTFDPLGAGLLIGALVAPLISTPAAAAVAFQNVLDAAGRLDPMGVVNALAEAPAIIADGFLNGGYGPDLGTFVTPGITVKAGGWLSPTAVIVNDDFSFYINTGGPIAALQQIFAKLHVAITPSAAAGIAQSDIARAPAVAAASVTVPVSDAPVSEPAAETPAGVGGDGDTTAEEPTGTADSVVDQQDSDPTIDDTKVSDTEADITDSDTDTDVTETDAVKAEDSAVDESAGDADAGADDKAAQPDRAASESSGAQDDSSDGSAE